MKWLSLIFVISACTPAWALFARTQADLNALADRLQYEFGKESERRTDRDPHAQITPILVAPPQAYWKESKDDFAPDMLAVLARVFPNKGDLINCAECYQSRVFMAKDARMVVQNGELSLADLARLRKQAGYGDAKSVLITKETPSGIEIRLLAIDDGRILYTGVVDSTQTLAQAERPMRLARELDRRKRGESLSYINIDLGMYPQAKIQLKFLEQWGDHNQHMSGFVISALNPTGAIGVTYQWMIPKQRRLTLGATVYYSLKGMFDAGSTDLNKGLTGQFQVNYAFSGSYAAFAAADSDGKLSVGISFLNPILFPFLL